MDRGIWLTWYDLPTVGREDYLAWLHQEYMPKVLKLPGYLWGAHYAEVENKIRSSAVTKTIDDPAVPTGSRYILLFGAEEAETFGDPLPSKINADLSEAGKKMLALRIATRTNIMAEYGRVKGPEAKTYRDGMMLANCIQLGTYNTDWRNEEDLFEYYKLGRLPHMEVMPGCVRTRKLLSVVGWAKHGVLYEFTSLELRNKHFIGHGGEKMKEWSANIVPKLIHAPGSANLALRIWPPQS